MKWDAAIRAMVATLDERGPYSVAQDPTIVDDTVAYVLEGTGPGVVPRLERAHAGFVKLAMHAHFPDGEHPARDLYDAFTVVPPDVLTRWGHVIHAYLGRWQHNLEVNGVYWPGTMLTQVGWAYPTGDLPFGFFDFARLLAETEVHSGRLVVNAWALGKPRFNGDARPDLLLTRLHKYGQAVRQLHHRLAPMLVGGDPDSRVRAFAMLAPVDDDVLAAYAPQVAEAVTTGSALVREAAAPLVPRLGAAGMDQLRAIAVEGKPDQRRYALLTLLDQATDEEQRAFVVETAAADRAASVRAVLDEAMKEVEDETPLPEVPDPEPVDWAVPWTDEVAAVISAYVDETGYWSPADDRAPGHKRFTPEEALDTIRRQLVSPQPVLEAHFLRNYRFASSVVINDALEQGALPTAAVVKLLVGGQLLDDDYASFHDLRWTTHLLHAHRGLTLLDLAAHLDDVPALDPVAVIARGWFLDAPGGLGRDWDPAAVWPFFARHLDGVLGYWHERRAGHSYGFDSEALFPMVATFPETPTRLLELCYDLALGAAKSDQRAAQDFLNTHPDAVRRASAALSDGNGNVRAVAAEWLGRLGDRNAVPALAGAFAKEKNETVQGALLDALVALGDRIEDHFDLAAVDAQAAKAMAKGLPAALAWLDTDRLPDVRRSGLESTVPRATMLWLVARATAAKSSVPGAVLRACTSQLDPGDAETFADQLLTQWVSADEESVGRTAGRWYGNGQKSLGPSPGAAAKGLLALVALCGGVQSVRDATRYVRTWHGQRAQQSKAVVTMLAHHREPVAAEALVAIAYRFKAPSIEKAAREEVQTLAERLEWTLDQLTDRTVATAGFDEAGALPLPYGERVFVARLLPDCTVELRDPDGNVLKTLPAARRSDDAEAVKESKKTLSAAKKALTETVKTQTLRFRDAMCAQRAWTGADWRQDLAGHPVLAVMVSRLVWVSVDDDVRTTFRLLDDGTLTDAHDEPVELADDALVRIAHDVTLSDDELSAWSQHLTDYEVPSLFWQLGRGRADLTDDESIATSIDAPPGVAVPSGRLAQVTIRLGYRRGAVGDSAAYDWFEKEFASLGLRARIGIDAAGIEDHESPVTVRDLTVESTTTGQQLALGDLPQVLLVELRHDLAVAVGA